MKITPLLLVPAASLALALSPARAEETAPASQASAVQALLTDLLKQGAAPAAPTPAAAAPAAATADGQTQELQTLLISVLKSVAEMIPQIMAALNSAQSTASAPSADNIFDFLDFSAASAPVKKTVEKGLRTGGLSTGGLNSAGAENMTDEDWRRIFQKRQSRP